MRAFIAYFSPLAIARTAAAKEEQGTPSDFEEASLRMMLAWSVGARRIGLVRGLSFPSGTPGVAGGGAVARCAGDCLTDPLAATERAERSSPRGRPCAVRRDAAPQERSDEHGGAAHGLGWGWPTDDEERAARASRVGTPAGLAGLEGRQARATPIAAPSKGEARRVGGGPRRQEPQRVAVGDKQQRGRTPRRLVETKRRGRRPNGGNRSWRGCTNGKPGHDHAGTMPREGV